MNEARTIMMTSGIGALAALLLAIPNVLPPAVANEEPARALLSSASEIFSVPLDPEGLVKWDFTVDPGISTEPIRQSTIKKIAYGRTEFVQVVETSSGIYSSDAMTSPYMQYPGIHPTPKDGAAGPLLLWNGQAWLQTASLGAGSFVTVVPYGGGQLVVTDDSLCAYAKNTVAC